MKEKRFLRILGEVDEQYIKEAEPMKKANKKTTWQKYLSIAACFALVAVIGVFVFQSGLSGTKTDIVTLDNGEKITFVKRDTLATSMDLDVTVRKLNNEEIKLLFADLPVTANAYFDPGNHNIIGFEGKIGDVKLVVSTSGEKLLDIVIEGNEYTSTVGDTSVNAGYFVTDANSQGTKTVIYYADFDIGKNSVYVEYSGAENEINAVRNKLVDAILKIIENGEFDLSQIQE